MSKKAIVLFFGLLAINCCVLAQPTPVVSGTKDKIFIGEPLKITLELKAVDRNAPVLWKFPENLLHFEYIGFDTTDLLTRTITITSWDSGIWKLENISVIIPSNVNNKPVELKFPAKEIIVEYDTTGSNILNDVKPIIEVDDAGEKWIGYTILAATLLSLLVLVYLFRKWKTKQTPVFQDVVSDSPLDEFLKTVLLLSTKNWASYSEQKQNFTELNHASKRYLQRTLRKPFLQFTTAEAAPELQNEIAKEKMQLFIRQLRLGDAVKFAKYVVPADECKEALEQTIKLIQQIDRELK